MSESQKFEVVTLLIIAFTAIVAVFAAWCRSLSRRFDSYSNEASIERKEIKENQRRAANGNHVQYDTQTGEQIKEEPP